MGYTVVYWNRATPEVYEVIRSQMPPDWKLVTLQGETEADWLTQLGEVDFMIVADWAITPEVLAAAPKLKMVQHQGVGHEKIDKAALKARGIPLALCPAGTTVGVAEHTILLILAVYKRLVVADTKMRQGTWLQWGLRAGSFELAGKTLGLLGFGRIAQAVAKRAHAFDAKILYHDPLIPAVPAVAAAWNVQSVSFERLLAESDIVSVHVPTTDETRKFLGAPQFQRMKRSAILINTARGAVVDEAALIQALQGKMIAGAGLDVFAQEPIHSNNPLLTMDNAVLTPHIAAGTVDALKAKMGAVFANLTRRAEGKPIQDRVV
jgi:phosphoglycerate dehydrogenase-like enzyme